MKAHLVFYIAVLFFSHVVMAKEIALSFDDAPTGSAYFSGQERTGKLIAGLKQSGVKQAAFFVIGKSVNAHSVPRLKKYQKAGHLLANHSFEHRLVEDIGREKYVEGISKTDQILAGLGEYKKWYRFPMLREGNDKKTRDNLRTLLDDLGYQNGHVTIDNYDWYLNQKFNEEMKISLGSSRSALAKWRKIYVDHVLRCLNHYDDLAIKSLGRSPKHVLLLHENDLAALFIADLVKELRKRKWKIISVEEAYSDPIYARRPNIVPAGNSLIYAIAKEKGIKGKLTDESESEVYWDEWLYRNGWKKLE